MTPTEDCTACPKLAACYGACSAQGCLQCSNGSWHQEAWDCLCPDGGGD